MLDLDLGDMESEDMDLDDSVVREALGRTNLEKYQLSEIECDFESKNELQSLIYTNLSLEYDIFLSEEDLKYYKILLTDKESEIKRLKQMHAKKYSKLNGVAEGIKRMKRKIKEVSEGYKVMMKKKKDSLLKEENHRSERLSCQQKKNALYQKYCDLEQTHSEVIAQIQNYQGFQADYNQFQAENQQIKQQIADIQARKKQIENGTPNKTKDELKNQIKKLYDKIKAAEKEELSICKEYQSKKKKKKLLEEQHSHLTQKSVELNTLYTRVAKLKQECKERKWVKLERQKEYQELLAEETQLKKEIAHYDYRTEGKRSEQKQKYVHNFKIIDSEADEEINRANKHFRSSSQKYSSESQEQFDQLIDRFQRLKSKSKNLT